MLEFPDGPGDNERHFVFNNDWYVSCLHSSCFCSLFERHWQFRRFKVSSYHQSFFFILLGHLSLEICTEWTETGRVALHFGTTLWVVLNRLAAMISGKNVRMNGKITLNVCTTRNWYEMRLICAKTNFEASIYRRWCRGVLHNIVIISAK